jgi:hypothetical protein
MKLTTSHLFKAGARLTRTGGCTPAEVRAWGARLTAAQLATVMSGYNAEKKLARLGSRAGRPLGKP